MRRKQRAGIVPQMVAVPEAPNRAAPAVARRQVKVYKRRERKKRKSSKVRTQEKPQNALIPKGAGCSAFLGAAARNAAKLELAEQERLANNPYVPRAAYSTQSSWASDHERAELEAQMAEDNRGLMQVSHRPSTPEEAQLFDEYQTLALHLTDAEKAELIREMDEVRRLSASISTGQQVNTADMSHLSNQFGAIAKHLPEAEKEALQSEMDEVTRMSSSILPSRQLVTSDTEFLSAVTDKYELLTDHLDAESRQDLEAEIAAVARISQELGQPELPSGWGSLIDTGQTQSALTPGSSGSTARAERRSKRRTSSSLKRLQLESTLNPDRPSSRDSMETYLVKRPLASPNAVNNDLLRKYGKGSLGVGWDEFRRYERPTSVTDVHSIESQLERRRKAHLAASWADRTAPEWDGPCSVPPLALPERSLIGITRASETVRDVFKGHTIQEDARTPRTSGWQPAQLSQIEVALRDGPARACTASVAPGVPALNNRPVALGAYVDRFWAGPALAGLNKQAEVSARRDEVIRAGRKSWSDKNRPPPLEVEEKSESDGPPSPVNQDEAVRFKACTVLASEIPGEYAENDALARIFDNIGHYLQGTCCAHSVKADLVDASGAWGLVTFATPEDVQSALQASKEKKLKAGGRYVVVSEVTEKMVVSRPTGSQVWADAVQAAAFQFEQLETKTLEFAGLLMELVQATGLPSMDLCGMCDPFAVININNAKTPEDAVCDTCTSAVCKTTKEPEWREDFVLPVPSEVVPDAELIVDIYDEDVGDDDDFMGRVKLKLSDMKEDWTDQWYELSDIEDSSYSKFVKKGPDEDLTQELPPLGLLRLRIRWVPSITDEDSELTMQEKQALERVCMETAEKSLVEKKQPIGKLTVHILRGQGLPKMDIFGTCDPFVTLEHNGKKVKTPVVKQSLTPVWDSTFHFDVHDMQGEFFMVGYDWDRGHDDDEGGDHDEIGRSSFNLQDILGRKRECEEWIPLFQSSTMGNLKTRGNILCKLEFAPAFGTLDDFIEPAEGVVDVAVLQLTVARAQDVPQMDEVGASDPYCVLSLHGVNSGAGKDEGKAWKSKDFKTKVVTGTLNPEWHQSFTFTIYDPTAVLHIDMYDEDFRGADDYMCGLRIPVTKLLNSDASHWYRLQDEETVNDPDAAATVIVDKPQQRALLCPFGALMLQTACKIESKDEVVEVKRADRLGDLHINIRKLDGLKLRKGRKKPSIFVDLEYDGVQKRTSIQKTTLNPVWNETFEYPVNKHPGLRSCVTCKIFLYDLLGNHELAGTVTIAMKDATERDSDFPISFPFFVFDDSSSLHKTPKKLGDLEVSLVWKGNNTVPEQETRPRASLRASVKHVVRATRAVLGETGALAGADQFLEVVQDAVDGKEVLQDKKAVKRIMRGGSVGGQKSALAKQADVLGQFGQMKGKQWVIIPTLKLIKLEGVTNASIGLSPGTTIGIWAEVEWNGEVVATTAEYFCSRRQPPATASDSRDISEDICYHCEQKGHWKRNCPLLNDNLTEKKEAGQSWYLGVNQPLPSTKTGSNNTLKIRLYARGTGVIGYSQNEKGNKDIMSFASSPPRTPSPVGSLNSTLSNRDKNFLRAAEMSAEADAAAARAADAEARGEMQRAAAAAAEAAVAEKEAAGAAEAAAHLAIAEAEAEAVAPGLDETTRASMDLDAARIALDGERKGQGYESDSSAGCSADVIGGDLSQFCAESEARLREIRDHLAFVEEVSSPTSGSDVPQAVAKFHSAQRALRERHLKDAIELYDDAIACGHPNPAQCHNGAALCQSVLGNHAAAQERFALAVSADPQDENIWHNNRSRESTPEIASAAAGTLAPATDPNTQLVQSELSTVPLPAAGATGSMMGMFDPSGLQMSSTGGRYSEAANSQMSSLGEEKGDRLREMFARADRNGDGKLSRSELILRLRKDTELALLLQLPQRVSDDERDVFEAVFQGMDQDDDRAITSEEFVAYFMSFKSEFERAGTPDSRPSTAATTSELLALTDGVENVEPPTHTEERSSPDLELEAEPGSEPERGDSNAAQTNGKLPDAAPSSAGNSRPSSRQRWRMISSAVREPTYGEKTVFLGSITLSATGVRGFPREPLPLNVMRDPDAVLEAGIWGARRYDGQLSMKVDSQSISDYANTVVAKRNLKAVAKGQMKAVKGFRAAQKHADTKQLDCSIKIHVSQARALTPMWRADGDIDQPPDACSAFVVVRPVCISLKYSCRWCAVNSCW